MCRADAERAEANDDVVMTEASGVATEAMLRRPVKKISSRSQRVLAAKKRKGRKFNKF